jgi:hypothetical protein
LLRWRAAISKVFRKKGGLKKRPGRKEAFSKQLLEEYPRAAIIKWRASMSDKEIEASTEVERYVTAIVKAIFETAPSTSRRAGGRHCAH